MRLADWFLAVASIIYFSTCIRRYSQIVFSPSPDIATVFTTVMIGWVLLTETEQSNDGLGVALFLSLGALSLKLSLAPVTAIVTLVEFWQSRSSLWRLKLLSFAVITYTFPFLLAQFFSSGFPLYPITVPNFQADWAIDLRTAELEAKLPTLTVPYGFHPIFSSNVPTNWFEMFFNLYRSQYHFLLFSLLNLLLCGYFAFSKKVKRLKTLSVISLIGNVFVISSAPDIRYGLCYVYTGISLFTSLFLYEEKYKKYIFFDKNLSQEIFYAYLLVTAFAFLPIRFSILVLLLTWVGFMALLLSVSRLVKRLQAVNLPLRWTPVAAALTVAGCLTATACAKDATEMAMESYAGAGLFTVPSNATPRWLLPPPTAYVIAWLRQGQGVASDRSMRSMRQKW